MWACFRKPRPHQCGGVSVSPVRITKLPEQRVENRLAQSAGAVNMAVLRWSLSRENSRAGASHLPWPEAGAAGTQERTEASLETPGQWEGAQGLETGERKKGSQRSERKEDYVG